MALKVKLSNGMKEIDTTLHKPVVFIGGVKKILDKGITFVNGEKKYLWGMDGISVDYISVDGTTCGLCFSIGDTWMNTSSNGNVYQFDITNLDVPVLDSTIAWGTVVQYSNFQSTVSSTIYGSNAGNVISVNPSTGVVSVLSNFSTSGTFVGITTNYSCGYNVIRTLPSLGNIVYGNNWFWNGQARYTTGTSNNPLTYNNTPVIQIDTDKLITNLISNNVGSGGLYELTPSGATRLGGLMNDIIMLDDNVLCGVENYTTTTDSSKFNLYDKTTYALVDTYTHSDPTVKLLFLGRIGDNYYLLCVPKDQNATTGVSIVLLDKSDLSVVHTQELESDPFEENNGSVAFWYNCQSMPQVSNSGFLSANTSTSANYRCARFGALL